MEGWRRGRQKRQKTTARGKKRQLQIWRRIRYLEAKSLQAHTRAKAMATKAKAKGVTRRTRWSMKPMQEDEKVKVREMLTRLVAEKGGQTEEEICAIARLTTVTEKFKGKDRPSAGDVVWAWVAECQEARDGVVPQTLARKSQAQHREPIARWQWHARVRSGWDRPDGVTQLEAAGMELCDDVLAVLWREQEGLEYRDWGQMGKALFMEKGTARKGWQKMKKRFVGNGGHGRYMQMLATLMLLGELEGGVHESPKEDWWEKGQRAAAKLTGHQQGRTVETTVKREVGAVVPEVGNRRTVRVVGDYMACTQSLARVVPANVLYLPYDRQEWVYSGATGEWVQNLVADLMLLSPQQLWRRMQRDAEVILGEPVDLEILMMGMGVCCKTFSKADSSNITRGHNYRDHSHEFLRPPKDYTSQKGKAAAAADEMVKKAIQVAKWFSKELRAQVFMENPVGMLCRQEYMTEWVATGMVKVFEVDYCAFRHMYMKPTHIWTTMQDWVPLGTTKTGRCSNRCTAGEWSLTTGKWNHVFKIAQGSWQAAGGKGRKARKNMMPLMLQQELMDEAVRVHRRKELKRKL